MEMVPDIQVIRTIQKENRMPPPPVIAPTKEPIIDDFEIIKDPLPPKIDEIIPFLPEKPKDPVVNPDPPKPIPLPMPEVKEVPEEIFVAVEEMPRFPGCEEDGLSKAEKKSCAEGKMLAYIYSRIKYPQLAKEGQVEGTAVVRFIIEKNGEISGLEVVKDPGAGLGREALRVVKTMPDWIPGKQRNKPVRVRYNLPVKYVLE